MFWMTNTVPVLWLHKNEEVIRVKKKTIIISVSILLLFVAILLVIKNFDSVVNRYEWHKVDKMAEKEHAELIGKVKAGQQLTSSEIGRIATYYYLNSKYDEGISVLQEVLKRQDAYMAYFELSGLHAEKAKMNEPADVKSSLVAKSRDYLVQGFEKVPDKALAFYMRGKAYALLGCFDMSISDLNRAIEVSKKTKTTMLTDGVYVDQKRFAEVVEKDIAEFKKGHNACLLDSIQQGARTGRNQQ